MRRVLVVLAAALTLAGCASLRHKNSNPYAHRLFIEQFLDRRNPLDAQIEDTIVALRENPNSAPLHNQLGQLLREKGFPKDSEVEFERAVNADPTLYSAWYNLGLVRQARGDWTGARFAYERTLHYRKGHSAALFQMGLIEEKRGNTEKALDDYAKAFSINHDLLDVRVNPRILDSKLIDVALVKGYPIEHARESTEFEPTPGDYVQSNLPPQPAPSPQAPASQIVPPAAPVTSPAQQTPPPKPPR
ncbi:MAG TPA: tetratricopeptide repeat protein [Thermoanaerobaculia bacterium]|nr:tetratricopeptide repeat protein [Thermoanaerobaculia bacterium]